MEEDIIPKQIRKNARKINTAEALQLFLIKKWTYKEIGAKYGVTKQAVEANLKRFMKILKKPDEIAAWEKCKAPLLTSMEMEYAEKLMQSNTLRRVKADAAGRIFKTIFDANRIVRGQSTEIVDARLLVENIEELRLKKAELLKEHPELLQIAKNNKEENLVPEEQS